MAGTYTLKVVADFASAHTLRDYPGQCARMHGHNWKVEVECISQALDKAGMAVDFKVIRRATEDVTGVLDHRYLNDLEPFMEQNPTAENIAAWFYTELSEKLNTDTVRLHSITLWETERACVRYAED